MTENALSTPPRHRVAEALALTLAFTTAGCGLVRITTNGGAAAPASGGTEGGSAELSTSGDDRLAQLDQELRQLTYQNVTGDHLAIDRYHLHIFTPRGRAYEPPPACDANPNPTWIPKWGPCAQLSQQPLAALVQARINETYAADLTGAIEKQRAAWRTFDTDIEARLVKAQSLPSLYERAPALFALFRAARAEMTQKKLPRSGNEEPGALALVAEAIFKAYDGAGLSFAFSRDLPAPTGSNVRGLDLAQVRAWSTDADEQKHFAELSMKGGAKDFIRGLPLVETSPSASPAGWVKWPFDLNPTADNRLDLGAGAIAKKFEEAAKKAAVTEYPHRVVEDSKTESMAAILGASPASKLVWVAGRVTRLENKPGAVSVELSRDEWKADTKCVAYGPITGVNRSGQFTRNEKCRNANERKTARRFRITLADWPKNVDLGDVVVVFGDLESVTAKGTKSDMKVDVTVTGRFVGCSTERPPVDAKAPNELTGMSVPSSCENPW